MGIKYCAYCGNEFWAEQGQRYCSKECQKAQAKINEKTRDVHQLGDELTCPICGEKFIKKRFAQKYCSKECRKKAANKQAKESMKRQRAGIKSKPPKRVKPMGLNDRLKSLDGKSYAEWQMEQTLNKLPKIL